METLFFTNKALLYIPLVSCLLCLLASIHLELSHGEGISIPEIHAEKRETFDLRVSEFIKWLGPGWKREFHSWETKTNQVNGSLGLRGDAFLVSSRHWLPVCRWLSYSCRTADIWTSAYTWVVRCFQAVLFSLNHYPNLNSSNGDMWFQPK